MPFYESVHCGIIRVELNEQYVWKVLRSKELNDFKPDEVKIICYKVEDELNCYAGGRINVDELIVKYYFKDKDKCDESTCE